jgi:hypothetical protein
MMAVKREEHKRFWSVVEPENVHKVAENGTGQEGDDGNDVEGM